MPTTRAAPRSTAGEPAASSCTSRAPATPACPCPYPSALPRLPFSPPVPSPRRRAPPAPPPTPLFPPQPAPPFRCCCCLWLFHSPWFCPPILLSACCTWMPSPAPHPSAFDPLTWPGDRTDHSLLFLVVGREWSVRETGQVHGGAASGGGARGSGWLRFPPAQCRARRRTRPARRCRNRIVTALGGAWVTPAGTPSNVAPAYAASFSSNSRSTPARAARSWELAASSWSLRTRSSAPSV